MSSMSDAGRREILLALGRNMNRDDRPRLEEISFMQQVTLPAHERVLDRLADLLFDADEVLDMLRAADAVSVRWVEPHLQIVYDEVNDVMKKLCD